MKSCPTGVSKAGIDATGDAAKTKSWYQKNFTVILGIFFS
jgi:hypothetical protein